MNFIELKKCADVRFIANVTMFILMLCNWNINYVFNKNRASKIYVTKILNMFLALPYRFITTHQVRAGTHNFSKKLFVIQNQQRIIDNIKLFSFFFIDDFFFRCLLNYLWLIDLRNQKSRRTSGTNNACGLKVNGRISLPFPMEIRLLSFLAIDI